MSANDAQMEAAFEALCHDYKTRCLWFLRPDYKPASTEETLRLLVYIERHGDLEAFRRAGPVRQWLLLNSKQTFAG